MQSTQKIITVGHSLFLLFHLYAKQVMTYESDPEMSLNWAIASYERAQTY